ncbi:hypothetical protein AMS68_001949 [Peltaster fructicola]|uniref:protein disulfide-isomerase n=1 Tax=Peltaster fructicola TaxID=286661 RepID=A0A6H0XNU5_9PEZI|nr:hypothetical protein AMS68_001949 [Peltaster fructicola]
MVHASLLASSLLLPAALAAGLYSRDSPVLNVDSKSYNTLIAQSNHTSIVEFYAPWCGHCQNLKGAYERAAKQLTGLAKVAAINCDDEENKSFCGSMGVKGFPTLKIVRRNPKKPTARPFVEDYQGPREAKDIVTAVIDKIPNHVARPKGDEVDTWVKSEGVKALLFSNKGTVSALLKSLAIDYLDVISFAQIRDKDATVVEKYGVTNFPTLVLLPGGDAPTVTYTGELKKEAILEFLKAAAQPNPDPPAKKARTDKPKTNKSKASKDSSSLSKTSASQASAQASGAKPSQQSETIVDDGSPIPSPDPKVSDEKPIKVPKTVPAIPALPDGLSLQQKCLNSKSGTCILLLLPEGHPENPYPDEAKNSLSEIHHKHSGSGRKIFPFYQLPQTNSQAQALRKLLKLDEGVEIIAINGKKSWWHRYEDADYTQLGVERWIDEIRMGEAAKQKLPKTVIVDAADLPVEAAQQESADAADMKAKLKSQLPEGVDFEFEEIDDAEYEKIMKADDKKAGSSSQKPVDHEEL